MSSDQQADIREMYMAHAMFRREIGLLPGLIRGVRGGETDRAAIVADHFALVHGVLHHHHHAEDTHLWPRLLARCPQDAAPVVQVMESQHGEMNAVLAEITDGLASWRETAHPRVGAAIAGDADRLSRLLAGHLAAEEERALPLIAEHITAAEWGEMVAEGAADVSPEQMTLFLGLMMYEGDPDVVRETIGHMPPEIRPVIAGLAADAFARHSELVYGTPTPARIGALR
jgi:Hemerythrin HHE cation binding domain